MSSRSNPIEGCFRRRFFQTTLVHIALVVGCAAYILIGAVAFIKLERPYELQQRDLSQQHLSRMQEDFLKKVMDEEANIEETVDRYIEEMFRSLNDPFFAHMYESLYTNYSTSKDMWTFESAALFTTTTVIPVGYGYICPATREGRLLVIIYGIIGIPLALVTMADTGKFVNQLFSMLFESQITLTIIFVSLLTSYIIFGGVFFHWMIPDISLLDAIYFSLTSIFTIGFGDIAPNINAVHLVWFLLIGIIIVTTTIDLIVAEVIQTIHYAGRGVGKAKEIAGKMLQMATSIKMNRSIHGLALGMNQLQALARLGLLGKLDKEVLEHGERVTAFAPALDDVDFMDMASIYASRTDVSRDDGRSLFLA